MAFNFDFPLTNSKGLQKIILFKGLSFPIIIVPSLLGEPILTVQPFYFIENLDAVARVRFENKEEMDKALADNEIDVVVEYNLDNYLFEYSKKYPDSKITTKIDKYVFWKNDLENPYHLYDKTYSEFLCLDVLNDESIIECKDQESGERFYDWCLIKNFADSIFDEYLEKMKNVLKKNIFVRTKDNEALGTGEFHLPIVRTNSPLLTYYQAQMFEVVDVRDIKEKNDYYIINRGIPSSSDFSIKQEIIETSSYYDKELLSYYFSALKDLSPLSQFRNYYNVIEFFFEEAPKILLMPAKFEYQMIEAVFKWAIEPSDMLSKLKSLPSHIYHNIVTDQKTSSGEVVKGLNVDAQDLLKEVSNRVYTIRNACMHSKKTRKGKPTPRYVPYTKEENILRHETVLLQWIAIKIIEKSNEL